MLRHLDLAWKQLQGEVSLDELLILEVIRASAPQVVDAVADFRSKESFMRGSQSDGDSETWRKQRLDRALESVSAAEAEHLRVLADYMCNNANQAGGPPIMFSSAHSLIQSVQNDLGGGVYWQRVWGSYRIQDTPSDQKILLAIVEWKKTNDTTSLAKLLETKRGYIHVFERLASTEHASRKDLNLDIQELLQLASAVNRLLCKQLGEKASEDRSEAYTPLWRMIGHRPHIQESDIADWLKKEIAQSLPYSLSLVRDLFTSWNTLTKKDFMKSICPESSNISSN